MGKIADAISNWTLPQEQKRQLLSLDREFLQMETKIQALEAENLKLQAKAKPLEREVQRLKEAAHKQETHAVARLDEMAEKALIMIVQASELMDTQVFSTLGLSKGRGQLAFDQLKERGYAEPVSAYGDGMIYVARAKGRA